MSQSGQLVATRSFSTELRWRVFWRCWSTNMAARPRVRGSRKKPRAAHEIVDHGIEPGGHRGLRALGAVRLARRLLEPCRHVAPLLPLILAASYRETAVDEIALGSASRGASLAGVRHSFANDPGRPPWTMRRNEPNPIRIGEFAEPHADLREWIARVEGDRRADAGLGRRLASRDGRGRRDDLPGQARRIRRRSCSRTFPAIRPSIACSRA